MTRTPGTYRFEYLACRDGLCFVGLKGPRGNIRSTPLTAVEMIRLLDAYRRSREAATRAGDGADAGGGAGRVYFYMARDDVGHDLDPGVGLGVDRGDEAGVPAVHIIAERLGISVEAAAAWQERRQAEARARDEGVPGDGAAGG